MPEHCKPVSFHSNAQYYISALRWKYKELILKIRINNMAKRRDEDEQTRLRAC